MKTLTFEVVIRAEKTKVWNLMLQDKTYREWTGEFHAGSYYEGTWNTGSEIRFFGPNDDGTLGGMYSRIKENRPFDFISIEHLGLVTNGQLDTESNEARKWASALENYTFTSEGAETRLEVSLQVLPEYQAIFEDLWYRALSALKRICGRKDNPRDFSHREIRNPRPSGTTSFLELLIEPSEARSGINHLYE